MVATDGATAARLIPTLGSTPMNALTTWYFTTDTPPDSPNLYIDSRGGASPLANVVDLTASVPSYSSSGRSLIAASAVGYWPTTANQAAASQAVQAMLSLPSGSLQGVATYPIRHALPRARPPFSLRKSVSLGSGLFVVGDHRDTPSIQGALVSGERGARAVLRSLTGSQGR